MLPYMHMDTNMTQFNPRYTVIMIMLCSIYEDFDSSFCQELVNSIVATNNYMH